MLKMCKNSKEYSIESQNSIEYSKESYRIYKLNTAYVAHYVYLCICVYIYQKMYVKEGSQYWRMVRERSIP